MKYAIVTGKNHHGRMQAAKMIMKTHNIISPASISSKILKEKNF